MRKHSHTRACAHIFADPQRSVVASHQLIAPPADLQVVVCSYITGPYCHHIMARLGRRCPHLGLPNCTNTGQVVHNTNLMQVPVLVLSAHTTTKL